MDKFFYATVQNGSVSTSGDRSATLGHKYDSQGIFAEWDWNGETLTARNDRYGYFPIYYGVEENKFGISSSIAKLLDLGFSSELDTDAFSVFLRLGWYLAEDTPFRSIRAVPPNATLTWGTGKPEISTPGIIISARQTITRPEAMEVYDQLFQRSIEKSLDDSHRMALPLSGGRDSRHILFALASAGRKPDVCLTAKHFPPRPDEDARVAATICGAVGVEHRLLRQPVSRFNTEIKKNRLTGFTADEHSWYMTLKPYADNGEYTFYDGIAGDVLSAGHFLDDANLRLFQGHNFSRLAEGILGPEGFLPALLRAEAHERFSRERAKQRLIDELVRHADAPNPVGSFYFWNRTRRSVGMSSYRILGAETPIVMPFLNNDVFDFLSALPAEMFLNHAFHTEMIKRTYPKFAHLAFEDKSAARVNNTRHFIMFSRQLLKFALSKRKTKLLKKSFYVSRCLRGTVDPFYGSRIPEFGERSVVLLQLERL
jgi:hypothetical protein